MKLSLLIKFLTCRLLCLVARHSENNKIHTDLEKDALFLRVGVILTAIDLWQDFVVGDNSSINRFFYSAHTFNGSDKNGENAAWHAEVLSLQEHRNGEPSPGTFPPHVPNLYLRGLDAICANEVDIDHFAMPFLATILQVSLLVAQQNFILSSINVTTSFALQST